MSGAVMGGLLVELTPSRDENIILYLDAHRRKVAVPLTRTDR
jgi:hypothetical protein